MFNGVKKSKDGRLICYFPILSTSYAFLQLIYSTFLKVF